MLAGKNGIVFGVANKRSIGWACALAAGRAGARLALSYQNERLREGVEQLAATLPTRAPAFECDVGSDASLDAAFAAVAAALPRIDFVVHSVAFAPREELDGEFVQTSRAGFLKAHEISTYSFTAIARRAAPLMTEGGALLTMSYMGANLVVPHYNVMGLAKASLEASVRYLAADLGPKNIRVNAISAGPIRTLAAAGIGDFQQMLEITKARSPLRRNIDAAEVGDAATFLCSEASRGITGTVMHVDAGFHITAL